MTAVLKAVLTKDDAVKRATSSYIGVLVGEAEVTVQKVRDHVNTYRLTGMDQRENKIDQEVLHMIQEVIAGVKKEDPVKGEWNMRSQEGVIWCDTSSLALETLLEIGVTSEDAAWLQKKYDSTHISIAELNATMHGDQPDLEMGTTSSGN